LTAGRAFLSGLTFLLGIAATLALPGLVWAVMIRTRAGDYLKGLAPLDPSLLLILLVAVGAILAPPAVSLMLGNSLSAVWASPGLFA
ncbi:hypothetical protein ABTN30_20290, partial [Acinetobacter baumannii]